MFHVIFYFYNKLKFCNYLLKAFDPTKYEITEKIKE